MCSCSTARPLGAGNAAARLHAVLRTYAYTCSPKVRLAMHSDAMFGAGRVSPARCALLTPPTGLVGMVSPGEEAALRADVAMQRALGARAEVIDAGLRGGPPGLSADDVECAAWEPNGGYGDGAMIAGDLLAAARARGVRYRPHSPVAALLTDGDRVTGVELAGSGGRTGGGDREHAGTVLLSGRGVVPGAAADRRRGPADRDRAAPGRGAHPSRGPGHPRGLHRLTTQTSSRPEAGGSMRSSAPSRPAWSGSGYRGVRRPVEDLAPLVQAAWHRVPALERTPASCAASPVYDMTPDARPLLGRLPGLDGLIVAAGFSGMGFKISPAVGEGIAGLMAGAQAGSVDLAPFPGLISLSDGRPIEPPNPYSDDSTTARPMGCEG